MLPILIRIDLALWIRIRIRIEIKNWIRIRIKPMRIHNTGKKIMVY
jgi:hypothetical protein